MKLFENKVLFIKDEEMFKEVKRVIRRHKKHITSSSYFSIMENHNYLYYCQLFSEFAIAIKWEEEQEITFEEFKQLLEKC